MKTKSLFIVLLTQLFILTVSAEDVEINCIYYNIDSATKEATVTKNPNEYQGQITIPALINYKEVDYSVTSIGERAFFNCYSLTSVIIPNSVTSIGNDAFRECI